MDHVSMLWISSAVAWELHWICFAGFIMDDRANQRRDGMESLRGWAAALISLIFQSGGANG